LDEWLTSGVHEETLPLLGRTLLLADAACPSFAPPTFPLTSSEGTIHFLHVQGNGPAPIPRIMTHGWPGSFLELLEILPLLTHPAEHGLAAHVSFAVVIPSLPGFGYSDRPRVAGVDAFRVALTWVDLVHALGYDKFAAQGGDLGAGVSTLSACVTASISSAFTSTASPVPIGHIWCQARRSRLPNASFWQMRALVPPEWCLRTPGRPQGLKLRPLLSTIRLRALRPESWRNSPTGPIAEARCTEVFPETPSSPTSPSVG
jgi:pimeloyl-ACP methyl ester carboxylesterase